jgi:hypothetical protein
MPNQTHTWTRAPLSAPQPLPEDDNTLLCRAEVAAILRRSIHTVRCWGRDGTGPKVSKLNGRPMYRAGDVRAWLSERLEAA